MDGVAAVNAYTSRLSLRAVWDAAVTDACVALASDVGEVFLREPPQTRRRRLRLDGGSADGPAPPPPRAADDPVRLGANNIDRNKDNDEDDPFKRFSGKLLEPLATIAVSPAADAVAATTANSGAVLWRLTEAVLATGVARDVALDLPSTSARSVAFSAKGDLVFVAGDGSSSSVGFVAAFSACTGARVAVMPSTGEQPWALARDRIGALAASPGGDYVFAAGNKGVVWRWRPDETVRVATAAAAEAAGGGRPPASSSTMATLPSSSVGFVNPVASNGLDPKSCGQVTSLGVSPDGRWVLAGGDKVCRLFPATAPAGMGEVVAYLRDGHASRVRTVAWANDNAHVACACTNGGGITLWRAHAGLKVAVFALEPLGLQGWVAGIRIEDELDEEFPVWDPSAPPLRRVFVAVDHSGRAAEVALPPRLGDVLAGVAGTDSAHGAGAGGAPLVAPAVLPYDILCLVGGFAHDVRGLVHM